MLTAHAGSADIARRRLDDGADANAQDGFGDTALHRAARRGKPAVARLLLARGAVADLRNQQGRTPLFLAAEEGQVEMIRLLVRYGANLNARDPKGAKPLALAITMGQTGSALALLDLGADPTVRNSRNSPALFMAAERDNMKVAAALLARGADPDAGVDGHTPEDQALHLGHRKMAAVLQRASVKVRGRPRASLSLPVPPRVFTGTWQAARGDDILRIRRDGTLEFDDGRRSRWREAGPGLLWVRDTGGGAEVPIYWRVGKDEKTLTLTVGNRGVLYRRR